MVHWYHRTEYQHWPFHFVHGAVQVGNFGVGKRNVSKLLSVDFTFLTEEKFSVGNYFVAYRGPVPRPPPPLPYLSRPARPPSVTAQPFLSCFPFTLAPRPLSPPPASPPISASVASGGAAPAVVEPRALAWRWPEAAAAPARSGVSVPLLLALLLVCRPVFLWLPARAAFRLGGCYATRSGSGCRPCGGPPLRPRYALRVVRTPRAECLPPLLGVCCGPAVSRWQHHRRPFRCCPHRPPFLLSPPAPVDWRHCG